MITLSIIIVTCNSEHDIEGCLDSIIPQASPVCEIMVVDNASTDRTVSILDQFKQSIEILLCESNLGYAKGNNIGFQQAKGKFVLLLNPDTVVPPGVIKKMVDYMAEHQDVTVLAPLVRNPDGSPQPSVRRFPSFLMLLYELLGLSRLFPQSKIFNSWRIPEFAFSSVQEVEQPMAAALLLRKPFFKGKLMDERFIMFFNDVDLCRRVWDGGGRIVFYPDAAIIHSRGASTAKVKEKMIPLHTKGFIDYLAKHKQSGFDRFLLFLFLPVMIFNAITRIFLLRFFSIDL